MIALNTSPAKIAALLFCCCLASCNKEPEPINYDWLQGEWVSSIEQTLAANSERGKPTSPSAGKLLWSVQGNRLYSTDHSIDLQQDSLFEIEAISETELRLKNQSLNNYLITKTETGFCAEPYGIPSDLTNIDCFVPYR